MKRELSLLFVAVLSACAQESPPAEEQKTTLPLWVMPESHEIPPLEDPTAWPKSQWNRNALKGDGFEFSHYEMNLETKTKRLQTSQIHNWVPGKANTPHPYLFRESQDPEIVEVMLPVAVRWSPLEDPNGKFSEDEFRFRVVLDELTLKEKNDLQTKIQNEHKKSVQWVRHPFCQNSSEIKYFSKTKNEKNLIALGTDSISDQICFRKGAIEFHSKNKIDPTAFLSDQWELNIDGHYRIGEISEFAYIKFDGQKMRREIFLLLNEHNSIKITDDRILRMKISGLIENWIGKRPEKWTDDLFAHLSDEIIKRFFVKLDYWILRPFTSSPKEYEFYVQNLSVVSDRVPITLNSKMPIQEAEQRIRFVDSGQNSSESQTRLSMEPIGFFRQGELVRIRINDIKKTSYLPFVRWYPFPDRFIWGIRILVDMISGFPTSALSELDEFVTLRFSVHLSADNKSWRCPVSDFSYADGSDSISRAFYISWGPECIQSSPPTERQTPDKFLVNLSVTPVSTQWKEHAFGSFTNIADHAECDRFCMRGGSDDSKPDRCRCQRAYTKYYPDLTVIRTEMEYQE